MSVIVEAVIAPPDDLISILRLLHLMQVPTGLGLLVVRASRIGPLSLSPMEAWRHPLLAQPLGLLVLVGGKALFVHQAHLLLRRRMQIDAGTASELGIHLVLLMFLMALPMLRGMMGVAAIAVVRRRPLKGRRSKLPSMPRRRASWLGASS